MNTFITRLMLIIACAAVAVPVNFSMAAQLPSLVAAGIAPAAPVIDGKLDDACWQNTIEIAPFINAATCDKKALEQTKAYICYDRKNLYIAFHCDQGCLDPAQNQLQAFKKDIRANDDDKFLDDDWVIVLLQPDTAKNSFYDLFINANGAVNDALCAGADPWGNRDTTWNSAATAKSYIGNGFWTVECAIPLERVKINPILDQTFGFQIGRRNCFGKEGSTWQSTEKGFHTPGDFGRIALAEQVPQVRNLDYGDFVRGSNTLSCSVLPPGTNFHVRLESLVEFAGSAPDRAFMDFEITDRTALASSYMLDRDGGFTAQFGIVNPLDLKTYYRTPAYLSDVKSSSLTADLSGNSVYEIYLNGRKIDKQGFLLKGENIVALKTEGALKGGFTVGTHVVPLDNTWKYSESAESNWNAKACNTDAWKFATAAGSEFKAKGYYRKSIVLNTSRFWPNWQKGGISIAQNSIQQLFLVPEGLAGRTLNDYNFYLEVPEEFKVLGASGYYKRATYSVKGSEKVARNGKNYVKYQISVNTNLPFNNKLQSYQFVSIPVQLGKLAGQPGKTEFYYYLGAENGNIAEVPRKLAVNILPPIRGGQPQKYVFQLWADWLYSMDNPELAKKMLKFLEAAGFNEITYYGPFPSEINLRNVCLMGFASYLFDCRPYLKEHPEQARIDGEGVKYDSAHPGACLICPTLLLEDSPAWAHVDKCIHAWAKKNNVKHATWDFEYPVWSGCISCFCPRCIAQFRNYAKIAPAVELNFKTIKKDYRNEWVTFMNIRFALLAVKFNRSVKKVSPEIVFSVYSGYQMESTREEYGVDWSMLADKIDYAMCGYGCGAKEVANTLAAVGKTPLVLGELVYPYDVKKQTYPAYVSKSTFLRRVTDGTGGVMIYSLTQLDGRTFYALAEVSRLVKDYEPLFLDRKNDPSLVKVSGIEPDNVVVFTDGQTRLIMIINGENVVCKAVVTNLNFGENMRVLDYYAGKDLGHVNTINADILPHDAAVFVVK
ncbi:MAG: hypothetical protein KJ964_10630 [Verrucomicrobia bacterium]|nr:hypothetical protein [Verrucomicrobiota bacterium]